MPNTNNSKDTHDMQSDLEQSVKCSKKLTKYKKLRIQTNITATITSIFTIALILQADEITGNIKAITCFALIILLIAHSINKTIKKKEAKQIRIGNSILIKRAINRIPSRADEMETLEATKTLLAENGINCGAKH